MVSIRLSPHLKQQTPSNKATNPQVSSPPPPIYRSSIQCLPPARSVALCFILCCDVKKPKAKHNERKKFDGGKERKGLLRSMKEQEEFKPPIPGH
mmetsp:Transcript_9963/g.32496  ORF Transcript_9963/g.32496 Transcript_9963/m.32496 type:complete len:95 (-) Transcript_9963:121-405(-)